MTRGGVSTFVNLIASANASDLDAVRSLCSRRYLGSHRQSNARPKGAWSASLAASTRTSRRGSRGRRSGSARPTGSGRSIDWFGRVGPGSSTGSRACSAPGGGGSSPRRNGGVGPARFSLSFAREHPALRDPVVSGTRPLAHHLGKLEDFPPRDGCESSSPGSTRRTPRSRPRTLRSCRGGHR